jgi:hypothetical protein
VIFVSLSTSAGYQNFGVRRLS